MTRARTVAPAAGRRRAMRSGALWASCLSGLAAALLIGAGVASAEEGRPIQIEVMVSHLSDRAGGVDQRALALHRMLQRQFRYKSLRVLQARRLALLMDEIGLVKLPNDRYLRVRPIHLRKGVLLMAIQVEGVADGDYRMRSRHPVVIGAQPFRDGRLVISLDPSF